MLILGRKERDTILFPTVGIRVEVVRVRGQSVRLGIDAPESVPVVRGEVPGLEGLRQPPAEETLAARLARLRQEVVCRLTRASELLNRLDRAGGPDVAPGTAPGTGEGPAERTTRAAWLPGESIFAPPTADAAPPPPIRPATVGEDRPATARPSRRRLTDSPADAASAGPGPAVAPDEDRPTASGRPGDAAAPPSPTGDAASEERSRPVRELYLLLQEIEQAVAGGTEEPFEARPMPRVVLCGGPAAERTLLTEVCGLYGFDAEALPTLDMDLILGGFVAPDVVVIDRTTDPGGMPVVPADAAAALAESDLPGTTWIELTAEADGSDAARGGGRLPVDLSLPKPIRGEDLVRLIRRRVLPAAPVG